MSEPKEISPLLVEMTTNVSAEEKSTSRKPEDEDDHGQDGRVTNLQQLLDCTTAWRPYPLFITFSMSFLWSLCALSAISPAFTAASMQCDNDTSCSFYSIQNEFHFDESYLIDPAELTSSIYFFGNLLVGQLFSTFADRFGRRPIIILALFTSGTFGCAGAFSPTFSIFLLARFLQGACYTPLTTVNYVLSGESVPAKSTSITSMFFGLFWVCGYCALAPLSVWFPTWRRLQFVTALPNLIMAVFLLLTLPESIAFSVQRNRRKNVEKWIRANERINCMHIEHDIDEIMTNKTHDQDEEGGGEDGENMTIGMLMKRIKKDPVIIRRIILETSIWIMTFMIYCGLSLTSTSVGSSDPLISFLFSGVVEFPAYIVIPITLRWTRRIPTRIACHFCCGCSLLALYFLDASSPAQLPVWLVAKCCAACCYIFCFIYASELFPTYCRTCCIGVCSTFCNIGAIVAPHIFLLDSILPSSQFIFLSSIAAISMILIFFEPETNPKRV